MAERARRSAEGSLSAEEVEELVKAVEERLVAALLEERVGDSEVTFAVEVDELSGEIRVKAEALVRAGRLGSKAAEEKAARLVEAVKSAVRSFESLRRSKRLGELKEGARGEEELRAADALQR